MEIEQALLKADGTVTTPSLLCCWQKQEISLEWFTFEDDNNKSPANDPDMISETMTLGKAIVC